MRRGSLLRTASLAGLGAAGLIAGHALGYASAVPDVHQRAVFAAQTGHGYMPSASWAATVVGLAALVAGIASGYTRRGGSAAWSLRRACIRLISMQVGAFILLEVLERLVSGASLATLSWRLVVVGVAAQIVVAALGALLLVGLRRVGAAIARLRVIVAPPIPGRIATAAHAVVGSRYVSHTRVRAPPLAHGA